MTRSLRSRVPVVVIIATAASMYTLFSPEHAKADVTFGLSFSIARSNAERGSVSDHQGARENASTTTATSTTATAATTTSGGKSKEPERVVDDAWVQNQIDDANRFFTPLGTNFRWAIEKELAEPHGELHSRADRDALTPLTEKNNFIDVFIVRDLEDVDEPGRFRMGVCWTGRAGKRFIVVARTARPTVLAHELGHFFGNQQHSTVVNNLMSYGREPGLVFLDAQQSATIKNFSQRFLETGRLIDIGPPRRFR